MRIAYLEKGQFWLYDATFDAFKKAFESYPDLSVEYVAHCSSGWFSQSAQLQQQADELAAHQDIDMILSAWTAAARALQAAKVKCIPAIGIAIADPLAAKQVASVDDSGVDNFTCRVIPNRWANMYRVFYDVVRFKHLGLMNPSGEDGKLYAAIDEAKEVASELGFSLVLQEILDESAKSCKEGLTALKDKGAGAFFMGPLLCFDGSTEDVSPIMNLINNDLKQPSFARNGSAFVQGGALMGFASWNMAPTGQRLAAMADEILKGKKPRDVDMKDSIEPIIAVNLETALEVGVDLPRDILIASDEIFSETSKPDLH